MEGLVSKWKNAVNAQTKPKGKKMKSSGPEQGEAAEPRAASPPPGPSPLQVPSFIKSKAQEIVDTLAVKGADPPSSTLHTVLKFGKVCEILLDVAEHERRTETVKLTESREAKGKSSHLTQVVADLEAKYIDSEQEKVTLKREKEVLSAKVEQLQREVNLLVITYFTRRQDVVDTLKRSQNTLESANKALLGELEEERHRLKEQQSLWELEVEHLRETLEQLQPSQ